MKKRVTELERQLSKMSGTSYAEDRAALAGVVRSCIGKDVKIELKEDHEDADIQMYGNTKHGKNTILDVDDEWVLLRTETPKGSREKLIRLESIRNIRLPDDAGGSPEVN